MNRRGTLLCIIGILLLLSICNIGNPRVIGGLSAKFTQAEIRAAEGCVLKQFESFTGCYMQKLWYNENISNAEYGNDNTNGMVLLSNFYVGASAGGAFEPNSSYRYWKWFLVREGESGEWVIKGWGYA